MFQRIGGAAMHKDLSRTIALLEALDNPQNSFQSVHIAGTNGKGSSAHILTSILMESGYHTGLYTSPHLKNFTERIRYDGKEVEQHFVVDFVNDHYHVINDIKPSFFEITVAMAFDYFRYKKIDIAIIEVGMGGRLDSTNVITPLVSLITQIGMDHMQFLGNTLEEIAGEKAGIIKEGVPVVIGDDHNELRDTFLNAAENRNSTLQFAKDRWVINTSGDKLIFTNGDEGLKYEVSPDLKGNYIRKNLPAVLQCTELLKTTFSGITGDSIKKGIENTIANTELKGRWQVIGHNPKIICDTGHNIDGVKEVMAQLKEERYDNLFLIWGSVSDKDLKPILSCLPKEATYFFTQPNIPRALDADDLYKQATDAGLEGKVVKNVNTALHEARKAASKNDLIFVGGSTFVVAELDEI